MLAAACAALGAVPAAAAPFAVGPGPVTRVVATGGHTLSLSIRPNRAGAWNRISFALRRGGTAVHGAHVTLSFSMPAMTMGTQTFVLHETARGVYTYVGPALVMAGRWNLALRVVPPQGPRLTALIADHVL